MTQIHTLGSYLRAHREARNLSQDEAGAMVSVSGRFWSDVETGEKILNQDHINQLREVWEDFDAEFAHDLAEVALFAPPTGPEDKPRTGWEKHEDQSGAWFKIVTRKDGAVIYADVWSVLEDSEAGVAYLWAAGVDGREASRGRFPKGSLALAQKCADESIDRLVRQYRKDP